MMKKYKFMKSLIRKIGLALVFISIISIGMNAQVVDFEYYNSCEGVETHFVSTSTYPAGITSYRWNFNDGSANAFNSEAFHTFVVSGVYYVTLEIFNNTLPGDSLIGSKSKNVAIYDIPVAAFTFDHSCLGTESVFINASTVSDGTIVSYQWTFGDGTGESDLIENPSHMYLNSGTYQVNLVITTSYGCVGTTSETIMVFDLPDATITAEQTEFCANEPIHLSVSDQYQYVVWGTLEGNTSPNIESFNITIDTTLIDSLYSQTFFFEASVYEVNPTGGVPAVCSDNEIIEITIHPTPYIEVTASDEVVIPGDEVQLFVTSDNADLVEYVWIPVDDMTDPFSANPTVKIDVTTLFTVKVVDEFGCKNLDEILVEVDVKPNNIVTPNADGKNDVWVVSRTGLSEEFELSIFNRLGEIILNQDGYQNDWDGTLDGNKLPEGAYYYVIMHGGISYTGSITLLR